MYSTGVDEARTAKENDDGKPGWHPYTRRRLVSRTHSLLLLGQLFAIERARCENGRWCCIGLVGWIVATPSGTPIAHM